MMKLLSATPSPYARKVRIALAEKRVSFELVTEIPWHAETSTPRYNPLEKLPVLILDDGSSVYDSAYILQWLELKYPEPSLFPPNADEMLAARKLEVLCDGVCDAVVLSLFERMRGAGHSSAEWLARQRRKIEGGMREVARLVGGCAFAVGDRFTLGDIAAGTVCGYVSLRFSEFDWRSAYPELADYSERIEQRASFQATSPSAQSITQKVV
jgi:glutathione S-transferase